MFDTETSKKPLQKEDNHIVAWSICFRAFHVNIATLYGSDPWELCDMFAALRKNLGGHDIYIYAHHLGYDWVFCRRFLIERFGEPKSQLNIKSYEPLFVKFENGIIFKDSLVLAGRGLERWALDLDVEHKKAVGKWDYNRYRNQSEIFELTEDELAYIEDDVRAGVECIDATLQLLKKNISTIPYTMTGIMRNIARDVGKKHHAHDYYKKVAPEAYLQKILEIVFHGGYTHANRYCTVSGVNHGIYPAVCYDFSSSYPFCMLAYKFPIEKFWLLDRPIDCDYVFKNMENWAFIMHVVFRNIRLKNPRFPMPCLSMYKASCILNGLAENGRCLEASLYECYINEIDLKLIYDYYTWDQIIIDDVYVSWKDYLPKWFSDIIYNEYKAKCELKGVDDVLYALEKAKFNSLYGMSVQKPVPIDIKEDYVTGEYEPDLDYEKNFEANYNKHLKNKNAFLPYQWGVWVTAYAQSNLFTLGECVDYKNGGIWLYSDTDSVYATKFDERKIKIYNEDCIKRLKDHGYYPVEVKGKKYMLGVAEFDGEYMQFKTLHSKCYCDRPLTAYGDNFVMGGDLKITVAGVPKRGAACLKNNIENFKPFFTFDGLTTKKLGHTHIKVDKIYTDRNGNITGDSIDLKPCDYVMTGLDRGNILYTDYMEVEQIIPGWDDDTQLSFFNEEVMKMF